MMRSLLAVVFTLIVFVTKAQITPADSSIQVVGYWSKNETQSYKIVHRKYKVKDTDTLDNESLKYQVDIKILDSTANSYTIEWWYKNFDISGSNKFTQSISSIFADIKIVIKTNEFGGFVEVVNWQQVRDEVKKAFVVIRDKFKDVPNIESTLKSIEAQLSTKASIESTAIQDILQYYTFHGGKYMLNDDVENTMVSNGVPGKPVEYLMTVRLDQLDPENDNAILRYWKDFDKKQMTDATYEVIKNMSKTSGAKIPTRDEIPEISLLESVGTRVHGSTGWIIYSILTKQTSTGDNMNVEEREIEILE